MRRAESERAFGGLINDGEAPFELALIEALRATGAVDEAAHEADKAAARLGARAQTITRPRWRASFLERVPENAAIVALARALSQRQAAQ
jgi:hypothetical protein